MEKNKMIKGIYYDKAKNSVTIHLHGNQYATVYFLPKSILEASLDFQDLDKNRKESMQNSQSLDKIAKESDLKKVTLSYRSEDIEREKKRYTDLKEFINKINDWKRQFDLSS